MDTESPIREGEQMKKAYPHFEAPKQLMQGLSTIRKGAHTTYNVNYHIVWIPKYRKAVLTGRTLRMVLEDIIRGQSESFDWQVLAFEIQPDHIHCFVSVPPAFAVSRVVHQLKGNTSRQLRRIFPDLKRQLGASLWADGYYASTAGYISEDKVKRYIEEQQIQVRKQEMQKAIKSNTQKTLWKYGG